MDISCLRSRRYDVSLHFCNFLRCHPPSDPIVGRGKVTNVIPFDCGSRCSEAQANIFIPSPPSFANALALARCGAFLVIEEDVRLLLEGAFALDRQLGRHSEELPVARCL